MANPFELIKQLNQSLPQAAADAKQSFISGAPIEKAKQALAALAEKNKQDAINKAAAAERQKQIDASIAAAGVKPSVLSQTPTAPINTTLTNIIRAAQSTPAALNLLPSQDTRSASQINQENADTVSGLYNKIRPFIVDQITKPVLQNNLLTSLPFVQNTQYAQDLKNKITNAASGALQGAVDNPVSNLFTQLNDQIKKREGRTTNTVGDTINDVLGVGNAVVGAGFNMNPLVAQYNAATGALRGNQETSRAADVADAITQAVPNLVGAGLDKLPISDEAKGSLSLLANIGLLKAGNKVGEGIGKRITNPVWQDAFSKAVANPAIQFMDPTGISSGISGAIQAEKAMKSASNKNLPPHLQEIADKYNEINKTNNAVDIRDVTPSGYGITTGKKNNNEIELLKGENIDNAVERKVGYQIDNGIASLKETKDGWEGMIVGLGDNEKSVIKGFRKQQVLNEMFKKLYPEYNTPNTVDNKIQAETAYKKGMNTTAQDTLLEEAKKYKSADEFDAYLFNKGRDISKELKNIYPDRSYIDALGELVAGKIPKKPIDYTSGIKVYHGTDNTFKEIDPSKSNSSSKTGVGEGHVFYTTDREIAGSYGKNILESTLQPKNPLVVDAGSLDWRDIKFEGKSYTINELANIAEKRGYGSLIVENVRDTGGKQLGDQPAGFKSATTIAVFNKKNKFDELFPKQPLESKVNKPNVEVSQNDIIQKTLATENKTGIKSKFNDVFAAAKNLPDDFNTTLKQWKIDKLVGEDRANREAYNMIDILDPITPKEGKIEKILGTQKTIGDTGKKFIEFMQNPTKEVADRLGLDYTKALPITDEITKKFDKERNAGISEGLTIGYLQNYLPQIWKDSPAKVQEVMMKSVSSTPFFSKERVLEDYQKGIAGGLTPKYSHVSQLFGEYIKKMSDAVANKKLVDNLINQKYIVDIDTANASPIGKTWKLIEIPGIPEGKYKAPPAVQEVLHNVFNVKTNGLLENTAKVSKFMQQAALTGGVQTVNGFTVGQAFKEMAYGMAHPIETIKNIATGKGTGLMKAVIKGFTDSSADAYFNDPENRSVMTDLAKGGFELNTNVGYKELFQNAFENVEPKTMKDKIKKIGGESFTALKDLINHSDDATFKRFMPILQMEFFKSAKDRLLKKGMDVETAKKTALEQTKNFYGLVDYQLLGRSRNTQNALSTVLFAPRFREGIVNIYKNTLKAFTTERKNIAFAENRRLAAGVAMMYGLYNALNYQLNGKMMYQNDTGYEGDLVIPQEDGSVIRIPFMPSFMTIPRSIAGAVKGAVNFDPKQAMSSIAGLFSSPIQTGAQVLTNKDYFGRPIYTEKVGTDRQGNTNTQFDKLKDIGAYVGSNFLNSYFKSGLNYARGKSTLPQAILAGLELPVKYGKQNTIDTDKGLATYVDFLKLTNEIERLQKSDRGGSNMKAIQEKQDEFTKKVQALSPTDKENFMGYKSGKLSVDYKNYDLIQSLKDETTGIKGEATKAAQPVFDNLKKISELSKDSATNKEEIGRLLQETRTMFNNLTPYEKKNGFSYLMNKKAKSIEDKKRMAKLTQSLFNYTE